MSEVKDAIGEEQYEKFRALIQATFPGSDPPDDATVDGFVWALGRKDRSMLADVGIGELPPEPPQPPVERGIGAPSYPLFMANATHHRVRSMTNTNLAARSGVPFQSEFVGHLPVVRVPLPPIYMPNQNPCIKTQIGDVYLSSDHLVGSVDLVVQKFGSQLGYRPDKVDLITPARTGVTSSRFGAIAVYLGYKGATDPAPSFFIFEAGMATGEAKMLYLGQTMETVISQTSGYLPTAYSSPNNVYTGNVTVTNNQLTSMWVQGGPKGGPHYIQVTVQYTPLTDNSNDPFGLLVEAAKRIALIGQNMGEDSGVPAGDLMAKLAGSLPWVSQPKYGGAGRGMGEGEQA